MYSPPQNPFSAYSWEGLLEEMHERQLTERDFGPEWDLLVEEVEKHKGSTPYP